MAALTRRVDMERVVTATSARRRTTRRPRRPRTPKVVELLRKALGWQAQLESGDIANQAAIATREGITRARVTQIMALLRLAPEIQQQILSLPKTRGHPVISERALRPVARLIHRDQVPAFGSLVSCAGQRSHQS